MPWGSKEFNPAIEQTSCQKPSDLSVLKALPEDQRMNPLIQFYAIDRANLADCKIKHDYNADLVRKLNDDS